MHHDNRRRGTQSNHPAVQGPVHIAVLARYKEKAGWAQKKTRQTPLLNDAHKDARIEYCVRNEGEDFRRRAMIDEKIFEDTPPRQ